MIKNPYIGFEDKVDFEIPTASLQIYDGIKECFGRPEDAMVQRASAATLCPKRRWYQRKGYKSEPLTPRKIMNFFLGDLTEYVVLHFIKKFLVGPEKMYSEVDFGEVIGSFPLGGEQIDIYKQQTVYTKITDDLVVPGHADGYAKRNSDGKWESIECKSASNWSFKSFKEDGPKDYLKQSHTIMASDVCKEKGITQTRYFYLRKETGNLYDVLVNFSQEIFDVVKQEFLVVEQEEEPQTPFSLVPQMKGWGKNKKPTGNLTAEFPCTYCPYLKVCHGDFEVEFKKDMYGGYKPEYIFERK